MSDPAFLNQAKAAAQRAETEVKNLELEQAKAGATVEELEGRLRDLGFDPEADVEAQVAALEADVSSVLKTVEERVRDLRASIS